MTFRVDFKSGAPVYLQLVDQVRYAAASGSLRPGEMLPCIRPLAEQLRVNRNTVLRAYSELENLGLIESLPGKGSFLKENNTGLTKRVRDKLLAAKIDDAVVTAHQLKIGAEPFLEMVRERIELLKRQQAETSNH